METADSLLSDSDELVPPATSSKATLIIAVYELHAHQ